MAKQTSKPKPRTQGMNWISQHKRLGIYLRDNLSCAYCGKGIEDGISLSLDHIKPYSKGGCNHQSNLVTCCGSCNSSRQDKPVTTFIKENFPGKEKEIKNLISKLRKRNLKPYWDEAKKMVAQRGSCKKAIDNIK